MLAGTHIALAVAIGTAFGGSTATLSLLAFGSLLPDIDHPQSTIGRIFFFASVPLHRRFGHRRTVHGFVGWSVLALLGWLWWPLWWIGLGALSHCFIDCLNVSGVPAFLPFSEKVCVLFARKWRFPCGSRTELGFMCVLALFAYGTGYIGSLGGLRAVVGTITGSPKIAYTQYFAEGTRICYFEGTLRYRNGVLARGRWLVIGGEGGKDSQGGFAIWEAEQKRIIRVPSEADFLRVALVRTDEAWQTLRLAGFARTRREAFFFDGVKWWRARAGAIVFGAVIGRELSVEMVSGAGLSPYKEKR